MLHFLVEVTMFKTMSLKAAANPMIIAGKSATSAVATEGSFRDSHVTKRNSSLGLRCNTSLRAPVVIICRAINSMDGSWVELLHQSITCRARVSQAYCVHMQARLSRSWMVSMQQTVVRLMTTSLTRSHGGGVLLFYRTEQ